MRSRSRGDGKRGREAERGLTWTSMSPSRSEAYSHARFQRSCVSDLFTNYSFEFGSVAILEFINEAGVDTLE